MSGLKHALQQPFITATALAAGVHSTWSLGTMFSGEMPAAALTAEFVLWLVPAMLIAFAIDIGQIATSAEIREGQRGGAKKATFAVLALATYYLQFIYIVHHMPALAIAPGVALFPDAAEMLRNAAIWIIPALLPISTILYTNAEQPNTAAPAKSEESAETDDLLLPAETEQTFSIECEDCDWSGEYGNKLSAANALKAHRMHNHPAIVVSSNGSH